MTALLPVSVQPRPPLVRPPRWASGETTMTDLPMALAWTAAITALAVPP